MQAFDSPGYGPIGHVDSDVVELCRRPKRAPALSVPERLAQVDLHRLHAGAGIDPSATLALEVR